MAKDKDLHVRRACARHGSDEIREMIVGDKDPDVRYTCVKLNKIKKINSIE